MCGIVGGTQCGWDYENAIHTLEPRGPDSRRHLHLEHFSLGFTRLAVIDPREIADQPMSSPDDRVWLVFNGEIYGFLELRDELERRGHRFRTRSDTEVLLSAYLEWGDGFIDRVDGMFSVALVDLRDLRLRLYRDRCGIKPLYYFWNGRDFAFGSELKSLEALLPSGLLETDLEACYDFLTYRYIPSPKTFYKQVRKLPPASRLEFDLKQRSTPRVSTYWRLASSFEEPFTGGVEDAADELRQLVRRSVRAQLVADVPLGLFLSGGLDSSVVVASAASAATNLQTFSIGFDDDPQSELHFAREVAELFETRHQERVYPAPRLAEEFHRLRSWYDEPFADLSAFPTFCVSEFARLKVTVALSGDGGDELFGGYRWHRHFALLRPLARSLFMSMGSWVDRQKRLFRQRTLLRRLCNLLAILGDDDLTLYTRLVGGMTRAEKTRYRASLEIPTDYDEAWNFRRYWRPDLPLRTRLQYLDFHTFLPDDVLTKVDRVSMANSLEVRVPLLSRTVVEFAFSLPEAIRYHAGAPKGIIRNAFGDLLPRSILQRGKRGFSPPSSYSPDPHRRLQEVVLEDLFQIT